MEDKNMKSMIKDIRILAALLTVGAAMTACSGDDIIDEQHREQTPETYTITVKATKELNSSRGLELSGSTLSSVWEVGERVMVVQNNASDEPTLIGELSATAAGSTTTLTGTVNSSFDPARALKFYLHATTFDYTGQDGTLASAGQNQTFASCEKTASDISVSGSTVTISGDLGFTNAQAVVRFSLVDNATSNPINARFMTVHDASGLLVKKNDQLAPSGLVNGDVAIKLNAASSTVFASLSGVSSSNLTLYASDGTSLYAYTRAGVTFQQGCYYQVQVRMTKLCSIGDVILSDGSFAAPGTAGAVAMVAYLGNDAGNDTYNRGLAIALEDEGSGTVAWSDNIEELAGVSHSTDIDDHIGFLDGMAETEFLNTKYNGFAATKAKNYAVAAPAGMSGWFLPSTGQWIKFFEAAGLDVNGWTITWFDSNQYFYASIPGMTTVNNLFEAAAPGSAFHDLSCYWTTCEHNERYAASVSFREYGDAVQYWYFKKSLDNIGLIRPFLAF